MSKPIAVKTSNIDRVIRLQECCNLTGRSPSTIQRDERKGAFPGRIRLGENSVGWRLSAIQKWIDERETVTYDNCKQVAFGAKRGRKPLTKVEA
jgi:prophage regulatory protein